MPSSKQRSQVRGVRGKPRGIRRDRDCLHCKDRGVKCDLNRPRCLPCVQAGLGCGGWPQRIVWANESPACVARRQHEPFKQRASTSGGSLPVLGSDKAIDVTGKGAEREGFEGPSVPAPPPGSPGRPSNSPSKSPDLQTTMAGPQPSLAQRLSALCRSLQSAEQPIGTESNDQSPGLPTNTSRASQLGSRIDEYLQARIRTCAGQGWIAHSPADQSLMANPLITPQGPADGDISQLHRLTALASLSEALETANPVAFLGIAVFAFFEVVLDAAFGEWQRHLRGARSLLDYHCRSRNDLDSLSRRVPGLVEMLAYFAWWDVVGNVTRRLNGGHSGHSGHSGQDETLIFLDWHRSAVGSDFFHTVGCPPETFGLLVSLAESPGDGHNYIQAMGQLMLLGSDRTEQGRCADAWRCAAAIAILSWPNSPSTPDGPLPDSGLVALGAAVDRICEMIAEVSPSSRFYTHLATPAFYAGINATSARHCDVLRTYWQGARVGEHPSYGGARAECEQRWRLKGII